MADEESSVQSQLLLQHDPQQEHEKLYGSAKKVHAGRYRSGRERAFFALNVCILLISISINWFAWSRSLQPEMGRYASSTDMQDAKSAVEYEERVYTGALDYDPETNVAFRRQDAETEYFGSPSAHIEQAWADLLRGEFPAMTSEEAKPYEPELKRIGKSHEFHFEPDVFHSLHCLNEIRIEVSKSLYNSTLHGHHDDFLSSRLPVDWNTVHLEHCMDRLRQAILCHGDLTPSPLYSWDGFPLALGRPGKHMCRKWQPIRDWMDERGRRGPVLGM